MGSGSTNFYNDAFVPILGRKHPEALGEPAESADLACLANDEMAEMVRVLGSYPTKW